MTEEVDYDSDSGQKERDSSPPKIKGRGHAKFRGGGGDHQGRGGVFETIDQSGRAGDAAHSVEGWILFVSGVHEEAQEDNILDKFCEYGDVKNIHVNLDRRSGYVKGYALVEFEKKDEAQEAIDEVSGQEILGQVVSVDWAFNVPPSSRR